MTFTACVLEPHGSFHVGEREGMREGTEVFIHSDTLFSALCHSLRLLYGRAELERFLVAEDSDDPPLVVSSAFPHWKDVFYFPVPRNQKVANKEQKKLRFVAQREFERLLAGGKLSDDSLAHGLPAGIIETEDVPRVTVPRLTSLQTEEAGAFYHVGQTWFKEGALFFLLEVSDDWRRNVEAAIRLMCDEGIGGYRAIGKGQFRQPEFRDLVLTAPVGAGASLLLSLYYPADAEAPGLADAWYDLVPRKGYVFSPDTRSLRRKQVQMFAEGSVFPGNGRRGRLVDVTPDRADELGLDHRVYRNGLAFAVPCALEVNHAR